MVPGSSGEVSRMNDDNGTYIPGTGTGGNMLWYQGTYHCAIVCISIAHETQNFPTKQRSIAPHQPSSTHTPTSENENFSYRYCLLPLLWC